MRVYDTPPDEQQTEGSRKQTKAAQRADLLHNNRAICCEFTRANDWRRLVEHTRSASKEHREPAQPTCVSDGANQEAPQASQLRLARRRPEFFGQAHERRDLLQLPCSPRSDLAHAALNSAAAQAPVAHELVKELAFHKLLQIFCLLLFFRRGGEGVWGRKK